jgi:hypothetical protein
VTLDASRGHVGESSVLTCQNELSITCGAAALAKASLYWIRSLSTGQQVLWLSAPDLMMTGDMKPVREYFRWSLVNIRWLVNVNGIFHGQSVVDIASSFEKELHMSRDPSLDSPNDFE